MNLLLDTHLLLWSSLDDSAAGDQLPTQAAALIDDPANLLHFSVASVWEVAIKSQLERGSFKFDAQVLRRNLLENGYIELPVRGEHAVAVGRLPLLHKDPFDRLLVAQAMIEGITLLTSDAKLAEYSGPVRKV